MHDPVIWALVMNSENARILRGIHRDGRADEKELGMKHDVQHLRDIMSDKPGRSYASVGSRRSSMEYASDPVRDAQRAFTGRVVEKLHAAHAEGAFDKLAVFASRPMLGYFRDEISPELARVVLCEVDKNYLHLSENDLRHTVAKALFEPPAESETEA